MTPRPMLDAEIAELRNDLAERGLACWASLPPAQVRSLGDGSDAGGSYTISGYASVFNTPTTLYDGKQLRITEEIALGAFGAALARSDLLVHLNHGHDMNSAIATTDVPASEIGGLDISQNDVGLRYSARVDSEDPDAKGLVIKMRRRVVAGASFKFVIGQEDRTESEDDTGRRTVHYRINQVSQLFDVCVCAQGAYRQATSTIRSYVSLARVLGGPTPGGGTAREVERAQARRELERLQAERELVELRIRSSIDLVSPVSGPREQERASARRELDRLHADSARIRARSAALGARAAEQLAARRRRG